ncbi:MAG: chorismate synthase [Desulfarculaceae bacterium]|nr:chorismate synthase [Desulfarculaceae bacterium]MCF8071657.1 chorismate synthase [Desulfarculaceae bacterium]MCF8102496.1 chorismate synthase [Desulfarculaceae bacterium]MCF8114936.1 chorismate synthase [Desulfarculaceae bacterium]
MGSFTGRILRIATFGESHGKGLGVVVEGVPAGLALNQEQVQAELDRRRPGASPLTSARQEADQVEILSGVAGGRTLGSPIAMITLNRDARSGDYAKLADRFRPGHADYTYFQKYGIPPQPGGGRASGRETWSRVAAGAVARAILAPLGVELAAYTIQVGAVRAETIDPAFASEHPLRAADPSLAEAMVAEVQDARAAGDSVGGVVELVITGVPAGLGDPVFDKLDARLGGALLSIGGVKGVEVGDGFAVAARRGSANNDQMDADGFASNHCGGILGGISNAEPIMLRLAIKPTPSISQPQSTRDLAGNPVEIEIHGRHDPCLCPRIAPVAEAMAALVLADAWLLQKAQARSES